MGRLVVVRDYPACIEETRMSRKDLYLGIPSTPPVRVKVSDGALNSIDYAHAKIHSGESFTAYLTNAVTNVGEKTAIAFNTGTAKEMHMTFIVEALKNTTATLYKDTAIIVDTGGTVSALSRNQVSPGTAAISTISGTPLVGCMSSYNETEFAAGSAVVTSVLDQISIPGGQGPQSVGGDGRAEQEWILGGGTQYALVMNALTNDDDTHSMRIDWYEED